MTSAEKVLDVERQIRAMIAGEQDTKFTCPFCTLVSTDQQFLCCNQAAEVVTAVLDHLDHIDRCDTIERTMDRMSDLMASQARSLVSLN